jgi:hypothetical protein
LPVIGLLALFILGYKVILVPRLSRLVEAEMAVRA